jgi:hypothetical protein
MLARTLLLEAAGSKDHEGIELILFAMVGCHPVKTLIATLTQSGFFSFQ